MSERPPGPGNSPAQRSPDRSMSGSGRIALAMMVMNAAAYGFTMVTARLIGPAAYGAFFSVMNVVLIMSVVQLGLQATAARRISAEPEHVGQIEREILRVSFRAALLVSALLLVGAPALTEILELDSIAIAVLLAVAAFPMTVMGAQAGILQGERRWRQLGVLFVLVGVSRVVIGLALTAWRPTELMAFLGVTLAFFVPFVYGVMVLRHDRGTGDVHARHGFRPVIKESASNSQALFAYFALTNADMLIGRTVLDSHESGLYAAGLIVSRAVLFLPQFVVVVAFPSMSAEHSRARALARSLALVTGLGALCTAGTALLPGLALVFAGGRKYAEIGDQLWLFAALGTAMAVLQLLVYSALARQGKVSVYLAWLALAVMIALASTVSSVIGLLTVVLVVDTTLLIVLLAISMVTLRAAETRPRG